MLDFDCWDCQVAYLDHRGRCRHHLPRLVTPCVRCEGSGLIDDAGHPCPDCYGTGETGGLHG